MPKAMQIRGNEILSAIKNESPEYHGEVKGKSKVKSQKCVRRICCAQAQCPLTFALEPNDKLPYAILITLHQRECPIDLVERSGVRDQRRKSFGMRREDVPRLLSFVV